MVNLPLFSLPAFLILPVFAFLGPATKPPMGLAQGPSLLEAWKRHPEGLYALGFGALMLLILGGLRLRGLASRRRAKKFGGTLDPTQVEELMLGNPPEVVDLRPLDVFRSPKGHIRGSLNIPLGELEGRLKELDSHHPRPIVLVDETDELSHLAAPLLKAKGHTWVYVLQGGLKAWRRAKLPIYTFDRKG